MKKLLAILLQPPIPHVLGLLLLSAIVYFGGQALEPWHGLGVNVLLMLVAGIWVLAALVFVWRRWQSAKRARLIEDRLRGQAREHIESVRPDKRSQVEELEQQLATAMSTLKNSKLGKGALYELPWYVIIGPPGSGKTTLLRESNLSFPDQTHGRGVRGVGGTRNCDWWFTDQGILLDTAGRYTTQDEDKGEWLQFLSMLKKSRARKPINGAILAISIADIVTGTEEQVAEHARKVRERLAELTQKLEVVFPVYLLFSKCDLLDGFVETFGGYGQKERAQTWGFTMPYLQGSDGDLAQRFDQEFDALMGRLSAERLQTLGAAKSQAKKAKVFSFPLQFGGVRERVRSFLGQLQQSNPYHESSDLRGVFFTSGTQEGQPFDQVLAGMREACGLELDPNASAAEQVDKKAYFIDDLFTDVVFGDKELARSSASAEKRRTTIRRVTMAGTVAATLAACIGIVVAYTGHSDQIRRSIAAHAAATRALSIDDLAEEQRLLEQGGVGDFERLRQVFEELHQEKQTVGSNLMGETRRLYVRVRALYVAKLRKHFVQPIQDDLRTFLDEAMASDGQGVVVSTFDDATDAYKMLAGKNLRKDWLRGYLASRWTWTPDKEPEACRRHLDTFLDVVTQSNAKDWRYEPKRDLAKQAATFSEQKLESPKSTIEGIRDNSELGGKERPVEDPVAGCEGVELIDPECVIPAASVSPDAIEGDIRRHVETRGDQDTDVEKLIERNLTIARADWRELLEGYRLTPTSDLAAAHRHLKRITANPEESLWLKFYQHARGKMETLGIPFPDADDYGWLKKSLEEVAKVCAAADPLVNLPSTQRILADVRGETKMVATLVAAIGTARSQLAEFNKLAPKSIRYECSSFANNLVDHIAAALTAEIRLEANTAWKDGVGKTVLAWSSQFPFDPNATASVDIGDLEWVLRPGDGELDKASVWIDALGLLLSDLTYGDVDDAFRQDREHLQRIQEALFVDATMAPSIEFKVFRMGSTDSTVFALAQTETSSEAEVDVRDTWKLTSGASIAVRGFEVGNAKTIDPEPIASQGDWGLLRVLAQGDEFEPEDYPGYVGCKWSAFRDSAGVLVEYNKKKPTAALMFRTPAKPNPLRRDFWARARPFTQEVLREN